MNLTVDLIKEINSPHVIDEHCNKFKSLVDITCAEFAKISDSKSSTKRKENAVNANKEASCDENKCLIDRISKL